MSAGLPSLRKINLMNTLVQLLYWAAGHPQSTH